MDIIAKLNAEYQHTEQQITDLGLEVCLILAVLLASVASQEIIIFHTVYTLHLLNGKSL